MIDTEKVKELTNAAIKEQGAFLVELSIGSDSRIKVLADHPEGITLEKLTAISRGIEHNLDREEADFSLEVSSPGIGHPFVVDEQYTMNVGRFVKVILEDGTEYEGDLAAYDGKVLTLTWKERVPKEVGKGKQTVVREEKIELERIKETRLEIRF